MPLYGREVVVYRCNKIYKKLHPKNRKTVEDIFLYYLLNDYYMSRYFIRLCDII